MIGLSIAERRKVASNVAGHLLGLHIAGGVLALLLLASLADSTARACGWRR